LIITLYVYYRVLDPTIVFIFPWQTILLFIFIPFTFVFYLHALRFDKSFQKYLRASVLFVISIVWLYIEIRPIVNGARNGEPYSCSGYLRAYTNICRIGRTTGVLSILCAVLILFEIWITFRNADKPVKPEAAQVIYVNPDQPVMPDVALGTGYYPPQPQYPQYPQYPYPGMIEQQPPMAQQYGGTPKYETQENIYQRQSQTFYQPQQQQQQYYQPQVPGSMVTAAPQPGASPIVPYPSPGHSVAVSPVLPVGGYSSPHSPASSAQ
ncbi:hypothetical protein BGZ79_001372, partial [Entomortierella chlamydospora]